ncbi:minor capsid protein [Phaeobacter gallaeciensis]|uniref:phage tail terminator protein n=1 Tax=Phaeobacter gallaeciensis TaxID=60890 RepID=UPI0023809324|nr:minor capsid protein [Phaeobacter gallaeciensis]MDE4297088.1 minor capsid protein [Phaeobacter gallaeciensis]
MIFDILEQKIVDAGLGVAGESLFRQFMPAETLIGIYSREPLDGIPFDPYMPGRYRGRIQIITRHTDPVLGKKLAQDVQKVLTVWSPEDYEPNAERGAASISLFIPETLPIQFPRLEGDGIEWSQHFKTVFVVDEM